MDYGITPELLKSLAFMGSLTLCFTFWITYRMYTIACVNSIEWYIFIPSFGSLVVVISLLTKGLTILYFMLSSPIL